MPFVNPFTLGGRWWRGNVHAHSDRSDGDPTVAERFAGYRAAGYDFLVLTDHDVTGAVDDCSTDDFLAIPGAELHPENPFGGDTYHILALNILEPIPAREMHVSDVLKAIRADGGLAVMAHPYWSGHVLSDYASLRDLYVGLEVYNHGAATLNGTSCAELIWDAHLDRLGPVLGFAADDAHRRSDGVGGGWIMVRAETLDTAAVMGAVRDGAFYSTQGPTIESLDVSVSDGRVRIDIACSAAQAVRFKGRTRTGRWVAAGDGGMSGAVYECRGNEKYVRVEVIDAAGRKAWTNPIYLADVGGA
ncbi:MAG: CehA/McbA family metallohydrolase [Phycisphaerae bacterium]